MFITVIVRGNITSYTPHTHTHTLRHICPSTTLTIGHFLLTLLILCILDRGYRLIVTGTRLNIGLLCGILSIPKVIVLFQQASVPVDSNPQAQTGTANPAVASFSQKVIFETILIFIETTMSLFAPILFLQFTQLKQLQVGVSFAYLLLFKLPQNSRGWNKSPR